MDWKDMAKKKPSALDTVAGKLTGEEGTLKQRADQSEAQSQESRNRFTDILSGGQSALETSVQAAMSSAMPEFRKAMQGVQETEIARGVGLGGLGTSYEGDLESAFHRNVSNAAGQQAAQLHATDTSAASALYSEDNAKAAGGESQYLDLLTGNRDYAQAQANAAKKRKAGLFGAIGSIGGAAIGTFLLPGIGTAMGAELGGKAGASFA